MVSTSNERYPESEDKHMRLNKLFIGLALGLTLASGTASTAEAKAKPVVVTVDKADASTARKVDAAFKKGKAVTLKVRGSKKASKALLIDLQKKTAETMRYSVHFDLDDGNRDCEGKGNKFHTYKDLDYKQSGNYGCYTFSKSTCNAYKYAFKFIKGNVDRRMKALDKRYSEYKISFEEENSGDSVDEFKEDMASLFQDIIDSNWYNIDGVAWKFFEDFVPLYVKENLGEVAEGSVDKLVEDALASGVDEEVIEELVSEAGRYDFKKTKPEPMGFDEFIIEEFGRDTLIFYKGGALEVDFSSDKSLAVRGIYLGFHEDKTSAMVYGGKKGEHEFDNLRKMKAGTLVSGTDEFRFKSLVNKTAHGICADYACVNRALIDYLGWRSYYVVNAKANHAVCALNCKGVLTVFSNSSFEQCYSSLDKDFDINVLPLDDEADVDETIEGFRFMWGSYTVNGWSKRFKDTMGADYPF